MNCPVCDKRGGVTKVAPISVLFCQEHGFFDGLGLNLAPKFNQAIIDGELKADCKEYLISKETA